MNNPNWPTHLSWDQAQLYQRLGNNNKVIERLLTLCRSDLPTHLASLHEAIEAGELQNVHHIAHTIKGIAANVCAQELSQLALEIEIFAQAEGPDEVKALWSNFQREHHSFHQQISEHLTELEQAQGPKPEMDSSEAVESLKALVTKLKAGDYVDTQELNFLTSLLPDSQEAQASQLIEDISTAVAHFDSQLALQRLANLAFIAKLEIAI
jgi:HPt (histidine-containing phosphotransfer) domain-containing protein